MTVLEVIQRSAPFLEQKGVESPRLQIELLLAQVLKMPRLKLYLNFDRALTEPELTMLREMVKRRAAREPLQHILGSMSFCGLEIKSSRAALVPRPETELLAERAWQWLGTLASGLARTPDACPAGPEAGAPSQDTKLVLDFGTGTGCIALAIAKNAPAAEIHAVDVSGEALALAKENAAANALAERITFHQGDGFAALPHELVFDLIVSNPPYIASAEIATLEPEVRDFDPRAALDGGEDGLDFYRRLAREAGRFLNPGGRLMVEFGDGQADDLKKIFSTENWIVDEIVADYSARPRILMARPGG